MATEELNAKWNRAESGTHYASARFATQAGRQRDGRMVTRLWAQLETRFEPGWILDMPSGTGRLQPTLEALGRQVVGMDISPSMLQLHPGEHRTLASAMALPLLDKSLAGAVCCRLFHHFHGQVERRALLAELMRVSRGPVLLSFWDAASWHAWRRRMGWRKVRNEDGRIALRKSELESMVAELGGEMLGYAHSFRGISQQAFAAFQEKREVRGAAPAAQ